jgi:glutaconyl-CoA/methylmalonyl-CoA decarboxylase subunit gamma
MLRAFRITVNGNAYDVMVEEVGSGPSASGTPPIPPAAKPQAAAASIQAAEPAASPAVPVSAPSLAAAPARQDEALSPKPLGSGTAKAPIPGTISAIKVDLGQAVARGDVILILDAMKMENEVCAESDGTVTRIFVEAGNMVNTGDPLLEIS